MSESDEDEMNEKEKTKVIDNPPPKSIKPLEKDKYIYLLVTVLICIIGINIKITLDNKKYLNNFRQFENQSSEQGDNSYNMKTFKAFGKNMESGYLKHVFIVLERLGYKYDPDTEDWDLLWAHDYPFRKLQNELKNLKPHQKINHFPGCGFITNKVDLAVSGLKYIPPAFKLPNDKDLLLKYATENPNKSFVQKNNDHRNIKVVNIEDVDLNSEGTFIQEYIDKPLIVSGHKFDIGIYTIITSIDPLRVYIYNGEALLRFCPIKYYPFDPENLDKYVVGDDYLPTWEVPALDYYYNTLGFNMKESLNEYLRTQGKNPNRIWEQIEDSIRITILSKEQNILAATKTYKTKRNFFEMMRFDFVVDEDLNAYLLEANMSPNLSSAHYPPNQLIYEQVLYNLFGLIGVGERIRKNLLRSKSEEEMIVADKNIMVFAKACGSRLCRSSCVSPECHLCKPCLSHDTKQFLNQAYKEHVNKGDCKRIFPPPMTQESASEGIVYENYSAENQLQVKWFQGKCLQDISWC